MQMLKTATGVDIQSMVKSAVDTSSSSSGEVVTGSAKESSGPDQPHQWRVRPCPWVWPIDRPSRPNTN
jgi:hypothetical protein